MYIVSFIQVAKSFPIVVETTEANDFVAALDEASEQVIEKLVDDGIEADLEDIRFELATDGSYHNGDWTIWITKLEMAMV